MSQVKIGNWTVLLSTTLMVPDGVEASISHPITESDILNCIFKFTIEEQVAEVKTNPQIAFEHLNDTFHFDFKNFESTLGHSTLKPIHFADTNNGEPITMLATIQKLKAYTKIEFQIMLEAKQ